MGKTAFCLNVATQAAVDGFGVAVFSLEMSKEALVQRMLCAEARVDSQAVRRGALRDPDFTRLARAAGILQSCPVWIDDSPALTLLEMRSKARRLKVENDVRLIIVDYLQLMRSPEYSENRVQEISDISRSLKGLARELEIPVIALVPALPRVGAARRGAPADPVRPARLGRHRAGRRRGDLHPPAGDVPEGRQREATASRAWRRSSSASTATAHRHASNLYFHKQFTRFDNRTEREAPE